MVGRPGNDPLKYLGVTAPTPPDFVRLPKAPTTFDTNFNIGTIWLDTEAQIFYLLVSLDANVAIWDPFAGGAGGIDTLEGDTGGQVPPTGGNVNIVGSGDISVAGDPGSSTLVISDSGGGGDIDTLTGNTGGAVSPTAGNIDVVGVGDITVTGNPGTSTLTISDSGASDVNTLTGNSGGAVGPTAGNIDFVGSGNVQVTGNPGTSTLTISDDAVLKTECGTGTTTGTSTADLVTIPLGGSAATFSLEAIVAGKAATADGIGGSLTGSFRTDGASATVIGSVDFIVNSDAALVTASFDLIASGNNVILRATGAAATTIDWQGCVKFLSIVAGV